MKERECDLSKSKLLNSILESDRENSQNVDTKCPLNCDTTILMNNIEQNGAQHCPKSVHVCQHCNFKVIHEEEVDKCLPECKSFPFHCTTTMHEFVKDGQVIVTSEEHSTQNSQKHLTLPRASVMETGGQLQDQVTKYREGGLTLKLKREELEKRFKELEQNSMEMIQKLKEEKEKIKEREKKLEVSLREQSGAKIKELESKFQRELDDLSDEVEANFGALIKRMRAFEMKNFSEERENRKEVYHMWYSPDMYTHLYGYKFCIGVCANGIGTGQGRAVAVQLFALPGQFDKHLKWPVKAKFTVELVNQRGDENAIASCCESWKKPKLRCYVCSLHLIDINGYSHFIEHSRLRDFLRHDSLYFLISKVEFC